MDDNMVYTLTDQGNSIIDKNVETMDGWLINMSDDVLTAFHRICNKNPDDRSDEEDYEICRHALVLYCRELNLEELAITADLLSNITGAFCANVIFESLRRKGFAKSNGPLLIYKDCSIELTDKGKEFLEQQRNKDDK
jgi:predicted transcriptional regulator